MPEQSPYELLTGNEIEIGDLVIVPVSDNKMAVKRVYGIKPTSPEFEKPSTEKYTIILDGREVNPNDVPVILLKSNGKVYLPKEFYQQVKKSIENPEPLLLSK